MQETQLDNSGTELRYNSNTICGFPISVASLNDNISAIDALAASDKGGWVVTINTEMLAKCSRDKEYSALLHQADFFTADGMPIIWASRHNGQPPIQGRTTGADLVEQFLLRENVPNYAVIGGVAPEKTIQRYPKALNSCLYLYSGIVDLSDQQITEFVTKLRAKRIRYVFLALGVPKQDKAAIEIKARYPEAVIFGIGGTFELLSTTGGRAPQWMQNSGLEWLYRFIKEPRRLWKRYILDYPVGICALLKDRPR